MWNINIHSMLSVYSQSEWRHGLHPDRALLGSRLLSSPPPTEATLAAPALRSGRCRGSTRPWKDECLLVEATHAPFSSPRAQTQQNKIKKHTGQFWRNFCPIVQLMKKKKGLFCRQFHTISCKACRDLLLLHQWRECNATYWPVMGEIDRDH